MGSPPPHYETAAGSHHMPGRCWCHAAGLPTLQNCELNWPQFLVNYVVTGISLYKRMGEHISFTRKLLEQTNKQKNQADPSKLLSIGTFWYGVWGTSLTWFMMAFSIPRSSRAPSMHSPAWRTSCWWCFWRSHWSIKSKFSLWRKKNLKEICPPVASFITVLHMSQGSPVGKTRGQKQNGPLALKETSSPMCIRSTQL